MARGADSLHQTGAELALIRGNGRVLPQGMIAVDLPLIFNPL